MIATERPELSRRIGEVLDLDPSAPAFEFEGVWHTWGELAASADAVAAHVGAGTRVGLLVRNRPGPLGLLLGLLRTGACVVAVNPGRGDDRVRADLADLDLDALAGEPADLAAFGPSSPARLRLSSPRLGQVDAEGPATHGAAQPSGVAVEMLTSGTTGPPKRVPLTYDTFLQVLVGAKHYEKDRATDVRLRSGVVVVNAPLVHVGGLFRVLQCVNDGRSFCLLDRFTVEGWADAVRRHRPRTVSLVPAALRMVLDADLDPDDLSSLRSVISGTAPLSPDDADEFLRRYRVPVLVSYGATEFGGGVAGWNLADHEAWWATKRGSVGRAHAGCELRVVVAETGAPLGPDEEGLLEVRARQIGDGREWTRTTDLARIDPDGFLWILGRSDQAIIRGGFKVLPETVRVALESDPRVLGAAVVGRADARLGAVPVAMVELRPAAGPVGADELLAAAARVLARYELPDELRIVDVLPRTPSGKVDLGAVGELFAAGLMDLTYSAADEAFRAELRAWLEVAVPDHGPPPPPGDWPARRAYDTAWQRKLHDAGYAGVNWPEEFGGRGLPATQQLVYLEEYARADAPYISVNFVGLMHAGPTLIAEGTDEQRAYHLPRILRGETVWAQGFSEPEAGSDLASLRTRAVRDGDDYVVNGQKIWSTRAHVADWCELLVRTDPDAPKHTGISWLILDMHAPGVEVRPMRTIDGESHFCEVFLTDVRVPVTARVGAENDGWRVTNVTLRFERGTAFAQHIITLRSQLRRLVRMAQRIPAEGGTAWGSTTLRAQVGHLDASIEALWRMTQKGIADAEATGMPSPAGSAVKLRFSELSQELSELAVRVLGDLALGGVVLDGPGGDGDGVGIDGVEVAREYLWSLQYTIAAGTSQIQRNLVAERILGMPKR